jgi:phosphatidylglycerophosphate synthase
METAKREMTFLLANVERRLLRAIAARLPAWAQPNHLSALGVAGAVGTGTAYALSAFNPLWLWVASLMLVVNWFGDSLDGTLARVRQTERPRYGYYLDHLLDALSTAVVGIGIGLSPYIRFELALVLVVVYLILSINVYLESVVFGVFKMGYGIVGPTEARIILVLANTTLLVKSSSVDQLGVAVSRLTNAGALLVAAIMLAVLVVRFGKNLYRLDRLEPLQHGERA